MNQTKLEIRQIKDDIRRAKAEFFSLQKTIPQLEQTAVETASSRVQQEIAVKAVNDSQLVLVDGVYKLAKAVSKLAEHMQILEGRIEGIERQSPDLRVEGGEFDQFEQKGSKEDKTRDRTQNLLEYTADFPLNKSVPLRPRNQEALRTYVARRLYDVEDSD